MRESALKQRDDQRKHLQTMETPRTKTNTKNSTKHAEQQKITDI